MSSESAGSTLARRIVAVWAAGARRFGLVEKNAVPSSKLSLAESSAEEAREVVDREARLLLPSLAVAARAEG